MQINTINKKSLNTKEILSRILSTRNVKNFIARNKEQLKVPEFCDYLSELCHSKNIAPKEVLENAEISVVYGRDIFSGKRKNPSRDYAIKFAFGFGLDYKETQKLLVVAGHSELYVRVPRDAVIINALRNKLDFRQTQALLKETEMTLL